MMIVMIYLLKDDQLLCNQIELFGHFVCVRGRAKLERSNHGADSIQ
jgi:hypothetical protein